MKSRSKHLTEAKIQRAIAALVEVMETAEYDGSLTGEIDSVCGGLRELQSKAVR